MKNDRTFLDKLLNGAEVKWKTVKSLCNDNFWLMPATPEFDDNGNIPYITSKNIKGGKIDFQNTKYINEYVYQELSKTRCIVENDILISMIGTIGEATIVKQEDLNFYGQNMYVLRLNRELVNHKFFLYYFTAPFILNSLLSKKNSSNQGYLKAGQIENLEIPIPPLSVQTEIVRILDALTALTSELTSELILRRKQYQYYRDKLLSEEELGKVGFEWRTLGELVEKTQNIRWKNNTKTYRYIDLTSVDRENNNITETIEINALNAPSRAQKIVKENDIIFATTRPTQQRIASITKEFSGEIASTGYCVLRANTDIVLPKWLFYFLSTINFKNYVEENQSGSAYPSISDQKVKEFRILVPNIETQQAIIEKLDKFYTLTNSLSYGLPKEIIKRKKQYLYYQKELLNFEK
ncbi:restriction modification system DNA specificity subunit [Aggregatibacter actinomycetemcomitans serotype e str. SC1083]|uniref:Restriction modification system DNA specificity subunit n=1 Tax=Aggregatibacter actinomycetemcomitans serotype e str. SC1083 TaxID=907488 RepID=G4A6D1_AGGAC|nr:restriction endonuclease subunit S [Aggregatibacter actinomycetemcomitans]EGY34896.1 restriction modification system DNA specificity subunit [Aggregatibacter actinomycetemcomitans serotype e str. SC1083]KYK81455.1 type I restriction modification protein [Aggregatibacter actinomycetemcomitans serotype e str. SC936]TYB21824.1 restriction endonuclease subunit S [Aggregatibacter actinomycetemcomitans]